jgi:hypothetical protein
MSKNIFYYELALLISVFILITPQNFLFKILKWQGSSYLSNRYNTDTKAYAEPFQARFILEDRKIKSIGIFPFKSKSEEIGKKITKKFYEKLKENKSDIEVNIFENYNLPNKNTESVLSGEIKEYYSEIKTITFSDFFDYDILEQQIKVGIEIKIEDSKTKDLLWIRKSSKFNSQRWIDYNRPRIGSNYVTDYFYIPTQLQVSMKKQYPDEVLVDKTINEVIEDLAKNLVKLK